MFDKFIEIAYTSPEVVWVLAVLFVFCIVGGFGLFILGVIAKHMEGFEKEDFFGQQQMDQQEQRIDELLQALRSRAETLPDTVTTERASSMPGMPKRPFLKVPANMAVVSCPTCGRKGFVKKGFSDWVYTCEKCFKVSKNK